MATQDEFAALPEAVQRMIGEVSIEAAKAGADCMRSEGLEGKGLDHFARSSWSQAAIRQADDGKIAAMTAKTQPYAFEAADANGTFFPQETEYAQGLVRASKEVGLSTTEQAAVAEAAPGYARAIQNVAKCGFEKMEGRIEQVVGEITNPYNVPNIASDESRGR